MRRKGSRHPAIQDYLDLLRAESILSLGPIPLLRETLPPSLSPRLRRARGILEGG